MCITSCKRKKIPSTDVTSVITETRRTAVKYVSCGLHYFWINLSKTVGFYTLSDCIRVTLGHNVAYYENWMHICNYIPQDMTITRVTLTENSNDDLSIHHTFWLRNGPQQNCSCIAGHPLSVLSFLLITNMLFPNMQLILGVRRIVLVVYCIINAH
jgi:hypothetical protein